jgi:predicted transcriptional regulator
MKRRPNILIYMEILKLLLDGPRGPTRLAQGMGLNFGKFMEFAGFLESRKLIRRGQQEEHEVYYITPEGVEIRREWEKVWEKLGPDVS